MDSIKINSGVKRVLINDDPNRVITFNPMDITFAEKFYDLLKDFEAKQVDYQKRATEIEAAVETDANGLPANLSDRIGLMREICNYIRGQVDHLFGAGTSQIVFEDALDLDMFTQFFDGITPFVQTARSDKLAEYSRKRHTGRIMK
jgi:hypothetical protein